MFTNRVLLSYTSSSISQEHAKIKFDMQILPQSSTILYTFN